MTLAVRVIPCLDVDRGRVVKGTRFVELRDAGDPVEAATRYEEEGADEVTLLDISAAVEKRGTLLPLVERVAGALSIPFTVGGGVRTLEDASALLSAGADRVALNTAAVAEPELVRRLAERFGSQCIVVAIDAKSVDGALRVTTHGGRTVTGRELAPWLAEVTRLGAGEVLLTSVDRDGTRSGFDLPMLRLARAATPLPLVASGGAGAPEHFVEAVRSGADAVLAAGLFHDRVLSIGDVKRAMAGAGVPVRPVADRLEVAFDERGLVPVVVRGEASGRVLMLAWANREALARTSRTGYAHFFSRSRQALWKKGETSGHLQRVTRISVDCDADAVLYDVEPAGPACHLGTESCFREVERLRRPVTPLDLAPLFEVVARRMASPDPGSYTNRLLADGLPRIAKKLGEEAVETALAAVTGTDEELAGETADLLYHLVVLLAARGIDAGAVNRKLEERRGKRRVS